MNGSRSASLRSPMGPASSPARTLVEKIWDDHVVATSPGTPDILYVDLHLVHEVTSPQAFSGLRARGLSGAAPDLTVATADHSTPTHDRSLPILDQQAAYQVQQLGRNCRGVRHPALRAGLAERQGIVHVIGPELGLTQPGMTIVCGDSHTATHGAFGALAFGIGTSEVEMVLATQCLLQRRPKTYEVRVDGRLSPGVSAKDIILALIARIGIGGRHRPRLRVHRRGHPRALHGRAHDGLQHVDRGRRPGRPDRPGRHHLRVPQRPPARAAGRGLGRRRRALADAAERPRRDVRRTRDAGRRRPRTDGHLWHEPGHGRAHHGARAGPRLARRTGPPARPRPGPRATWTSPPGQALLGQRLDVVFIGSCTNSRISDLRAGGRRPARPARRRRPAGPGRTRLAAGQGARPSARASTRSSGPPAPSGARPAARCASP